jgi:hypothetical protein
VIESLLQVTLRRWTHAVDGHATNTLLVLQLAVLPCSRLDASCTLASATYDLQPAVTAAAARRPHPGYNCAAAKPTQRSCCLLVLLHLPPPPPPRESENGERIKDLELIMAKVAEVRVGGRWGQCAASEASVGHASNAPS